MRAERPAERRKARGEDHSPAPGLVKKRPAPRSRPGGRERKGAIKSRRIANPAGHQLTFIMSESGQTPGSRREKKQRERGRGGGGRVCGGGGASARTTAEKKGPAIKTDDFLLHSDYPPEAELEPYKPSSLRRPVL